MKVEFKDFYGQHVDVHNETASGNIRLRVRTTKDLDIVQKFEPDECPVVTDISLTNRQANFLYETLKMMLTDDED